MIGKIGQKGLAQIPLMIALLLMAVAIPIATRLVQENQNPQNRAAGVTCCCGGTINGVCMGSYSEGCCGGSSTPRSSTPRSSAPSSTPRSSTPSSTPRSSSRPSCDCTAACNSGVAGACASCQASCGGGSSSRPSSSSKPSSSSRRSSSSSLASCTPDGLPCLNGLTCVGGFCIEPVVNCGTPNGFNRCPPGQVCVNNECKDVASSSSKPSGCGGDDLRCPNNKICVNNACVDSKPGYTCERDTQCQVGCSCPNHSCVCPSSSSRPVTCCCGGTINGVCMGSYSQECCAAHSSSSPSGSSSSSSSSSGCDCTAVCNSGNVGACNSCQSACGGSSSSSSGCDCTAVCNSGNVGACNSCQSACGGSSSSRRSSSSSSSTGGGTSTSPTPVLCDCRHNPSAKVIGDANCDGSIDIYDASIWRSEFADQNGPSTSSISWKADFNCDGYVNMDDMNNNWLPNYINKLVPAK